MTSTLVDFDWKLSATLASDCVSKVFEPKIQLTLYYLDEEKKRREAFYEMDENSFKTFLAKLHQAQDVVRKTA
ncbi:MAG: hypothetical protein EZS28_049923 [Streblomastix strix]|uniref:COMM domain-containing protein n=1 Tax=Streblomastix strix TaxID=222440 RepID=A0A5J4TA30_9EUKA|nr:MAG: hypothetical protein EZS28_049923 [Streblomastix strix]